jgi:hypothetical protein
VRGKGRKSIDFKFQVKEGKGRKSIDFKLKVMERRRRSIYFKFRVRSDGETRMRMWNAGCG